MVDRSCSIQNICYNTRAVFSIFSMSDLHHKPKLISVGVTPLGIISIGIVPMGVFSIGIVPMGVISLGAVSMGLLSAGTVAMGVITAGMQSMGIVSIGPMGMGQVRISLPSETLENPDSMEPMQMEPHQHD